MTKVCLDGDTIFLLRDFLTAAECDAAIALSERTGYEAAPISTLAGPVIDTGVRNNTRLVRDDLALAADWWHRVRPFVPAWVNGWEAVGVNERFRYYRYDPGKKFAMHLDGTVERGGEQSHYTLMVYLNDDFLGGATNFFTFQLAPHVGVKPVRGAALVFKHRQFHEGAPVIAGRKYVLRSDVFYAYRGAKG